MRIIMFAYIFVALMMWVLLKINLLILRSLGRVIGMILGTAGYLFLGMIAVMLFGFAMLAIPAILVAGVIGLLAES